MQDHEIQIQRHDVYATVRLMIGGRKVAETTMDRNVTALDPRVDHFMRGYFHMAPERKDND